MVGSDLRPLIPLSSTLSRESLSDQVITNPPPHLYTDTVRDLLSLASPDSQQMDYWAAVQLLNDTLKLGLSRLEHNVVALMVTGLSQTRRFRNELYLEPRLGDNSAIHSCHTAVLASELFRRAGLLNEEHQTADVIRLRTVITFAALMHDMGEMFGEPTSLAERQNNAQLLEANDYERPAFIGALRLAYWAVENKQSPEFYRRINSLRELARDPHGIPRLDRIPEQVAELQSIKISEEAEKSLARFVNAYDIAEAPDPNIDSPQRLFAAALVKTLERCQGTRHYLRFGTKNMRYAHLGIFFGGKGSSRNFGPVEKEKDRDSISFRYHYPPMVVKQCVRTEENLCKLWKNATNDSERALARVSCDAVFAMNAEFLNAGPAVYDMRTLPTPDPFVTECFATFRQMPHMSPERRGLIEAIRKRIYSGQVVAIRELRKRRAPIAENLFEEAGNAPPLDGFFTRIFRRDELVALYMRAIDRAYEPTTEEPLISRVVHGLPPLLRKNAHDGLGPERQKLGALREKAIEAGLTARAGFKEPSRSFAVKNTATPQH